MRILIFFLFAISSQILLSQAICGQEHIDKLKKDLKKAEKRKFNSFERAKLHFEIAECFRKLEDTNCYAHYRSTIELSKKGHPTKGELKRAISIVAYSNFYLDEYDRAALWFGKSIKADYDLPNAYYYRGISLYETEDYKTSLELFQKYKEQKLEFRIADSLINECLIRLE